MNFKRISLAAAFAISAFGSDSLSNSAFASGTHPTGDGGADFKGAGHCLVLSIECKGTYTDATDKNGTVYGNAARPRRFRRRPRSSSAVITDGSRRMAAHPQGRPPFSQFIFL